MLLVCFDLESCTYPSKTRPEVNPTCNINLIVRVMNLFITPSVMIVTNQSCQSLIARFVQRCDTIASVLTVREMSRSPLPYDLHANRSRSTKNFKMFFVDARRRLLLQLRHRFIFQITLFSHTVFCVAFHISTPGLNLVGVLNILLRGRLFHFYRRTSLKHLSLGLSFLHRPLLIFDCVPGGLASFMVLDPGSPSTFANLSTTESSFPCDPPSWCRQLL